MFDYPNLHVTETSYSTRRVREAGHASHRRERIRRMEDEDVIPRRRGGVKGRRADVEHQPEQQEYMDLQQEQPDVKLQHMEEMELEEELQAMDEKMEDAEPRRRRKKKEKVVDPEPLDYYPGGPHETGLLWKYHVHVARKASEGEVFIDVKLTLNSLY